MICFRDRAYCSASNHLCANTNCSRYFGPEQEAAAREWWGNLPGEPPVAYSNFAARCEMLVPVQQETA